MTKTKYQELLNKVCTSSLPILSAKELKAFSSFSQKRVRQQTIEFRTIFTNNSIFRECSYRFMSLGSYKDTFYKCSFRNISLNVENSDFIDCRISPIDIIRNPSHLDRSTLKLSASINSRLIAFDKLTHASPPKFFAWARHVGGDCPYEDSPTMQEVNFSPNRGDYKSNQKTGSLWKLAMDILKANGCKFYYKGKLLNP